MKDFTLYFKYFVCNYVSNKINYSTRRDVVIELKAKSLLFILSIKVGDQLSVIVKKSVSVVHDFPAGLRVEPAETVVKLLPKELSWLLTFVEEPVISSVVRIFGRVSKLTYRN